MEYRRLSPRSGILRSVLLLLLAITVAALLAGCVTLPEQLVATPEPGSATSAEQVEPLRPVVEWVVYGLETSGIAVIVGGSALATVIFAYRLLRGAPWQGQLARYREHLGQAILLGLEFLVGADIVGTVAVAPNFRNVGALGLIVIVRTFLSFTLEVETTGYWPWQRQGRRREDM